MRVDDLADARAEERVRAGRRLPVVRAGLERHVRGRAARPPARPRERHDLGVRPAPVRVPSLPYDPSLRDEDAADRGVGLDAEAALLGELQSIGCVAKGIDAGLVDFYALRDDQLVYLCWQVGEPGISHWHPLDVGFDGRQPIDHLLTTEVVP